MSIARSTSFSTDPESHGDRHQRRSVPVLDSSMSYVDVGEGRPIVFLHGNPTWSYVWRNVIPYVKGNGRCLAPDLIGMGLSGLSPSGSYRFHDHVRYLDAWFEKMNLGDKIVLVSHDWGTALASYWASRYRSRVAGFAYMEGIIRPSRWSEFPDGMRKMFQALRSPVGRKMIMEENLFIEGILPHTVIEKMDDETMNGYRMPYRDPERREAMLAWPRELPINGEPEEVADIVTSASEWIARSDIPKLLIAGDPGAALSGAALDYARSWSNQKEVKVKGSHVLQEDSPRDIGQALSAFIGNLP
ncbi:haloalkane dehalogenase [Luteibacter anthropi]|nr:haloalkane dehalogenase [Luteibacter anthropi]